MKRIRLMLALLFSGVASGAVAQVAAAPNIDLNGMDPELRKHLVEPPRLTCVSQDYEGPLQTARYVNKCAQPLHLTIVFGNTDDAMEMDVPAGKSRNLNFTLLDYAQRKGSSWYVCPKGYRAVDAKGAGFKRPVEIYICREIGY